MAAVKDDEVLALIDDLTRIARERGASRIEVESGDVAVAVTVDAAPPAPAARESAAAGDRPSHDRAERVHASTVGIFSAAREWSAGDRVERGAVLGAIQSLGHMAEVTAPVGGALREVLVAGGAPVEYGQPLFVIDAR
ncbi:MAG TPA: biotin/lipoyl-containing protein [Candidatus Limnocylindria bacterium]|nr:biotin/lipoyl-containing protein [Candidatus Limnocylindria bacterium]